MWYVLENVTCASQKSFLPNLLLHQFAANIPNHPHHCRNHRHPDHCHQYHHHHPHQYCPNLAKGSKWQKEKFLVKEQNASDTCILSYIFLIGWVVHEILPGRKLMWIMKTSIQWNLCKTMKITLLYQGKNTKKYKELGPAIWPCNKRILLYPTSL